LIINFICCHENFNYVDVFHSFSPLIVKLLQEAINAATLSDLLTSVSVGKDIVKSLFRLALHEFGVEMLPAVSMLLTCLWFKRFPEEPAFRIYIYIYIYACTCFDFFRCVLCSLPALGKAKCRKQSFDRIWLKPLAHKKMICVLCLSPFAEIPHSIAPLHS